jgi:hypothetical protein
MKRILMLAQLLLAAFLIKFLDANSDSGGSDSDSGGSDSDSGSSDSESAEGSSDGLSSSLETMEWSDSDSNSGDSSNQSGHRKKPVPGAQDLLSHLPQEDLSQIPRRNDFPGPH